LIERQDGLVIQKRTNVDSFKHNLALVSRARLKQLFNNEKRIKQLRPLFRPKKEIRKLYAAERWMFEKS